MPLAAPVTTMTLSMISMRCALLRSGAAGGGAHGGLDDAQAVGTPGQRHEHGDVDPGVDVALDGGPHVVGVAHDVDGVDHAVAHAGQGGFPVPVRVLATDLGDLVAEARSFEVAGVG